MSQSGLNIARMNECFFLSCGEGEVAGWGWGGVCLKSPQDALSVWERRYGQKGRRQIKARDLIPRVEEDGEAGDRGGVRGGWGGVRRCGLDGKHNSSHHKPTRGDREKSQRPR